ncbi:MAG: flap endonuclease-1 [archaeon]
MGLQISEIIPRKEISIESLKGKIIAVDAFNTIYQFLSTIRQPDGTPLMDSRKRITSHLSGLFYRNVNLLTQGLRLVYVFDGKPPEMKGATNEARLAAKEEARAKYEAARTAMDTEAMARYSRQTTHLTSDIIEESKMLLSALGIPVVQAPGEGEAQAAYICRTNEEVYAAASQDYDALLFGSPKLIQNLTLARKRRLASGLTVPVQTELIELDDVLNTLQLNHEQLISLGILVGTDYNPGGIKGIGPKKALQIVRQYQQPEPIFKHIENQGISFDFDWQKIFSLFKNPDVTRSYSMKEGKPDENKLDKILCEEHDFSRERLDSALEKLKKQDESKKQSDLKKWF